MSLQINRKIPRKICASTFLHFRPDRESIPSTVCLSPGAGFEKLPELRSSIPPTGISALLMMPCGPLPFTRPRAATVFKPCPLRQSAEFPQVSITLQTNGRLSTFSGKFVDNHPHLRRDIDSPRYRTVGSVKLFLAGARIIFIVSQIGTLTDYNCSFPPRRENPERI